MPDFGFLISKMYRVHTLVALEGPELQPYLTMRRQHAHRENGIFVAEGEKVVRRLLESSFGVRSLLVPKKWFEELEPLLSKRPEEVQVYLAEKSLLENLTGFSMYQGLLGVGIVPELPSLEKVIQQAPHPRLFAAVDGLSSAENLGAVVRNAAAFGAQGLLVSHNSASPFLRRAVRSSMGAIFHLPVVENSPLPRDLAVMKAAGIKCVAAHPHASGCTLAGTRFAGDCCIVLGSEGAGISEEVLRVCDEAVAVPMPSTVDSLNVASAAAVFLWEVSRQRASAG